MRIDRRAAGAALAVLLLVALAPLPVGADALDDLLFDLELVPLDGQAPPPLDLERLGDGKRQTLVELKGRPVMLYFWATW
jgi:hypothetical protein